MDFFESRDTLPWEEVKEAQGEDRVRKSFDGATVLITGATGFLGKLLLEKILRSCPEVRKIYLLIREKKNVKPRDRIVELFKEPVLERVRRQHGSAIFDKVEPLTGDCSLANLGLSAEDVEQAKGAHYVFHVAAALNMDEPISAANQTNATATRDLLEMATHMPNLRSFVYVSTAFSHSDQREVKEDFYDVKFKHEDVLNFEKVLKPEQIGALSHKIMDTSPNTYSFTKKIAEDVVRSYVGKLPVTIIRPSIVIGCYKEPLVGWVGSVNGATGVLLAAALGVMRVWAGHYNLTVDMVPADMFINCTIFSAWKVGENHKRGKAVGTCPIFNYVSWKKAPTSWGDYMKFNERSFWDDSLILSETLRPYSFQLQPNWTRYRIKVLLTHVIPGLIIDGLLKLTGKKPMLMRGFRKIHHFNSKLYYYCMNEWYFDDGNVDLLSSEMTQKEQEVYPFNLTGFQWEEYFLTVPRGLRVYLMKDPMDTKEKAWTKYRRMEKLYQAATLLTYSVGSWILYRYAINSFAIWF